jgi:hypothetical protein
VTASRSKVPADGFDRRLTYTASAAALVLFVPLLYPVLGGRIFAIDDLSALHAPLRHVYQSALTAGDSILWTSQLYGGFYIHAEGEVGALHPLHLLLYRTLPLTIALNLEMILSYVFAFVGMLSFLRRLGFAAVSSIVGSTAFAFSGFTLLHLPHLNMVAVVAHLPWLLYAIDLCLAESSDSRAKGLVAVAVLVGSQALLGHPQAMVMCGLICALYAVASGNGLNIRLAVVGLASVAGLMLAGIQLVPTLDALATSVRNTFGSDFALSYSLHPLNILQLFSPYLLLSRVYAAPGEQYVHEFGAYSGALSTLAFSWAIVRGARLPFARLAVFAIVISSLGLLLALGRYGFIYQWLAMLPVLGKFRAPARHILLVHFGFAVLLSILFEDVYRLCGARSKSTRRQAWIWLPLVVSAAAGAVIWWLPQVSATFAHAPVHVTGILIGLMIFSLSTLLLTDAARGSRAALMLLPCLLAVDLGIWGYSYVFGGGVRTVREIAATADRPPADTKATVHQTARTPKLNLLVLDDFRVLRPGVGLPPHRRLPLSTENELRVSGAEWVSGPQGWRPVVDPMPRVRFVTEAKVVADPIRVAEIDVRRTALVTEDLHLTRPDGETTPSARLVDDGPGHIVLDVSTRVAALLITTEAYDHGWRASAASGTTLKTVAVYGDYLGVVAEPGEYRMTLLFKPDSMRGGAYTSGAGLMLIVVLAAFVAWTR